MRETARQDAKKAANQSSRFLKRALEEAGIALPLQLLHRLADEESQEVLLPTLVALDLRRILLENGEHHRLERALVRDLGEAFLLHDLIGRLPAVDDPGDHFLRRRRGEDAL